MPEKPDSMNLSNMNFNVGVIPGLSNPLYFELLQMKDHFERELYNQMAINQALKI